MHLGGPKGDTQLTNISVLSATIAIYLVYNCVRIPGEACMLEMRQWQHTFLVFEGLLIGVQGLLLSL